MEKKSLPCRLLALVAALSFILVANADTFVYNGIYYRTTGSNTVLVTHKEEGYNNTYSGIVNIPSSVPYNGVTCQVTAIGDYAFYACHELTKVTIPNSVTAIGRYSFTNSRNLSTVTFGNSVTTIGYSAFEGCSALTSLTLPNSVTSLDFGAFRECAGIETVTFSNSLTTIGNEAFSGCTSLKSVTIPSSVTNLGEYAFWNCISMTSVTIPNSLSEIASSTFAFCYGLTDVTIPSSVTRIGPAAFYCCHGLESVTIGPSVTTIDQKAFTSCSALTSVTCLSTTPPTMAVRSLFDDQTYSNGTLSVPSGRKSAYQVANWWKDFSTIKEENYDFVVDGIYYDILGANTVEVTNNGNYGTYSGSVTIPSSVANGGKTYSVTNIGIEAFKGCTELTRVTLPNTVTSISAWAFEGCTALTSLTLPNSLTFIGSSAFEHCSALRSLTLPNSVTTLGDGAFCYCTSLTSVNIPNSLPVIQEGTFQNCNSLASVTIPNSVVRIDKQAFRNCWSLTSVTIPNSVTLIGVRTFYNCSSLASVSIGSSVSIIGDEAFSGCSALNTVECKANTPPTMDARTVFDNRHYSYTMLYVLPGRKSAYQAANWWSSFSMIFEMKYDFSANGIYYLITGANTVAVSYRDGNYNSYSGSVTIPSSVTNEGTTYQVTAIGDYAFNSCTGLTSVTIPNTVTSIGDNAFQQCETMDNIVIPNSVTSIGNLAFMLCNNLTYMVIPNSVTTIGTGIFLYCERLEEVVIGSSVTSIGEGAFMECGRLNHVECLATTPPTMAASNVFDDFTYSIATLKVPKGYKSAYQAANWWRNFTTIKELEYSFIVNGIYYSKTGSTTVSVAHGPLSNCYRGHITIPATVTYGGVTYQVKGIDESAFRGEYLASNNLLTGVTIPSSVTAIGAYAFMDCKQLTSVVVPAAVTTINWQTFDGCSALQSVVLGRGVNNISYDAFVRCNSLKSIVCLAQEVPYVSNTFPNENYTTATLFVPKTSLESYLEDYQWNRFSQVKPHLDYALNTGNGSLVFTSTGDYPWIDVIEGDRVYATSGNKGIHSSTSVLTTTVNMVRDGSVSFDYKAWGEGSNYDVCVFSVDGTQKFSYGNKQNNWITYTIQLAAGTHTLVWTYTKDSNVNSTGDYFAVDNVAITMSILGDIDGDGVVGISDVADLVDLVISGTATVENYPEADVDGDGRITIADVADLLDSIL